jgi:hypothetical protein
MNMSGSPYILFFCILLYIVPMEIVVGAGLLYLVGETILKNENKCQDNTASSEEDNIPTMEDTKGNPGDLPEHHTAELNDSIPYPNIPLPNWAKRSISSWPGFSIWKSKPKDIDAFKNRRNVVKQIDPTQLKERLDEICAPEHSGASRKLDRDPVMMRKHPTKYRASVHNTNDYELLYPKSDEEKKGIKKNTNRGYVPNINVESNYSRHLKLMQKRPDYDYISMKPYNSSNQAAPDTNVDVKSRRVLSAPGASGIGEAFKLQAEDSAHYLIVDRSQANEMGYVASNITFVSPDGESTSRGKHSYDHTGLQQRVQQEGEAAPSSIHLIKARHVTPSISFSGSNVQYNDCAPESIHQIKQKIVINNKPQYGEFKAQAPESHYIISQTNREMNPAVLRPNVQYSVQELGTAGAMLKPAKRQGTGLGYTPTGTRSGGVQTNIEGLSTRDKHRTVRNHEIPTTAVAMTNSIEDTYAHGKQKKGASYNAIYSSSSGPTILR